MMTIITRTNTFILSKEIRKKNGKVNGKPFYTLWISRFNIKLSQRDKIMEYMQCVSHHVVHDAHTLTWPDEIDTWRFYKKQDALDLLLMLKLLGHGS